jgi:WbqC-like protein family
MIENKIGIHQPNYFPWLGFFMKMSRSDIFVFHDNVEYTKSGTTRRCKIGNYNNADEFDWLTIPLQKHSDFSIIKELKVDNNQQWKQKHLNKIYNTYHEAPYFNNIFPLLENIYSTISTLDSLAAINMHIIKSIAKILGIEAKIYNSSTMPITPKSADDYHIAIVKFLNGTHYIVGKGASNYQEDQSFLFNQIQISKNDFGQILTEKLVKNTNVNPSFSIIEVLMKMPIDSIRELLH